MSNILTYKGYSTRIEFSKEDCVLHGKIEGIVDLVDFESEDVQGVEAAFHEAVDDYLEFCMEVEKEPDREYKGSFNVRVKPELHRELDMEAHREGISMNQFIENGLTDYLARKKEDRGMSYHDSVPIESPSYSQIRDMWCDNPWKNGMNNIYSFNSAKALAN